MVYAAWRRKLPAALTEADAHLGLANRLAAPFAKRVFLAYGISGRDGSKYRVTGRPVPRAHLGVSQDEGPAPPSGSPATRPCWRSSEHSPARAVSTSSRSRPTATRGRPCCTSRASGTTRGCAAGCTETTTSSLPRRASSAPLSPLPTSRSRAPAARSGSSRRRAHLRSSFPIPTRPPTTRRRTHATSSGAAAPSSSRSPSSSASRPWSTQLLADRPRLESMRAAMLSMARPQAADEIAEELIALATSRR